LVRSSSATFSAPFLDVILSLSHCPFYSECSGWHFLVTLFAASPSHDDLVHVVRDLCGVARRELPVDGRPIFVDFFAQPSIDCSGLIGVFSLSINDAAVLLEKELSKA
jgi:hypothetical protein